MKSPKNSCSHLDLLMTKKVNLRQENRKMNKQINKKQVGNET